MWDWIGNNANELKATGTLVGGLASGYSAYTNAQALKEANQLNKTLMNRQITQQDKAQEELDKGFSLSNLGSSSSGTTLKLS